MAINRTPILDQEIWRLKNKDKPIIRENTVPPSLMDSPLEQRNLKEDRIFRLASESAEEEAELDLMSLLKEFRKWKKNNKGGWRDFLNSNREDIRIIKLKDGGPIDKRNLPREPGVKQIDLMGDFHKLMDMLSKMSPQERESIQWLVDKTFGKKK